MAGMPEEDQSVQEGFNKLAGLLLFRERFLDDPQSVLEEFGLHDLPMEAVEVLAGLSPEELTLFAQIQTKLTQVRGLDAVSIIF